MARLTILLSDNELRRVADIARRNGMSVEEFTSMSIAAAIVARQVKPKRSGKVLTFQALKISDRRKVRD